MRYAALVLLVALLAGCGGSSTPKVQTTAGVPTPAATLGAGARVLYQGGAWAVVVQGAKAVAAHLVGAEWVADRSGSVRIRILGPEGSTTSITQAAVEFSSPAAVVESGLWVDGRELLEKGGGTGESAKKFTIYGTPDRRLKPGRHVAVAYGRTATTGTAVAWTFRVV